MRRVGVSPSDRGGSFVIVPNVAQEFAARIFDIVPGRSERELAAFLSRLRGREKVKVVCIDLSSSYRALVRRWFPNARIVADRFHVVRVLQFHFLELVRQIVPELKNHRGRLAALRRHPSRHEEKHQATLENAFIRLSSLAAPLRKNDRTLGPLTA
jgi:transposase